MCDSHVGDPLIVIPARYGSTRIPGKPLSKIKDEALISLVCRRVQEFGITANVVVATDDPRIEEAVSDSGVRTVCTQCNHKSGTERVAEVVQLSEFSDFDTILNIQGDQLFLPKGAATGAGCVVTKNVKPNTVVVGVPARPLNRKAKRK